jgi:Kef-type K+ transport system membrane component KefB
LPTVLGELLTGVLIGNLFYSCGYDLFVNLREGATAVLAAAVLGKWVSGLGACGKINRIAVGFGMMPRGEVGMAFAFIGKSLGVIDSVMFAVVVVMVVVTTLATPLMLRIAMDKNPQDN